MLDSLSMQALRNMGYAQDRMQIDGKVVRDVAATLALAEPARDGAGASNAGSRKKGFLGLFR